MTNKQTIRSVLSMLHIVRPKKIAIVQSLDAWMGIPAGPISEWNADGANYKKGQVIIEDHGLRFRVLEVRKVAA